MITCATYNILHGRYKEMILGNIRLLIKEGVDVFCLQETSPEFEKEVLRYLRREGLMHWKAEFVHKGAGGHVGLLWNANKLALLKSEVIPLPTLGRPSKLQRIRGSSHVLQRVALIGHFRSGGMAVNVVCVHLSWEGGVLHRMRQVRHVRKAAEMHEADHVIIGGDFNTIGPRIAAKLQTKRFEKIFGADFKHLHPHVPWSFDTSFGDPLDTWKVAQRFHEAGIRWRTRLDYMFARNFRVVRADMYDLPGSDHRPLIASLEPLRTRARGVLY